MSFNFSFTAPDKETAKFELCERNTADGGSMPEAMKQAAQAMVDAMPEAPDGYVLNVTTYGHVTPDNADVPGPANVTLAITHVAG